jgi:cell wall-associated NlpC family hydrolase
MADISSLIGIPWKDCGRDRSGVDCWGLVRLAYIELFDLQLPKYDGVDPEDNKLVSSLIQAGKVEWCKIYDPKFGDLLLFFVEIVDWPTHCAMAINSIKMLNIRRGQPSGIDYYDDSVRGQIWKMRLTDTYRHERLM